MSVKRIIIAVFVYIKYICLQCFDTVGLAARRASDL